MYERGGATRPLDRVVRVDVLVIRSAAAGRTASAPACPMAADAASLLTTRDGCGWTIGSHRTTIEVEAYPFL